ncbi:type VI secretion protein ImpB [Rubinisphaera sp.]|uniref:Y-family DNA polymerase n=1 Tax=Rubinisphaera sp. TaxID=2024857 RepID=UPI0025E50F01|nr:type VI secretion protein ImpB [Rubinisphaera sp.]|tara:strand:- start:2678 stop:3928 length:1251 start_codon:yes stop_codon:yes gene_type:complete
MNMRINWLFVDMNSYFASVEQQLRPELRGKPVGVIPMMADTTCCIAASYEAKAFGIRTGTRVSDAKILCPEINLVVSRTREYVEYHKRIVKAVESVLPVDQIHSIDEMSCRLLGADGEYARALQLGKAVKNAIKTRVGIALRSSVGLAPNRLLAKVASNMQKPDGLTLIRPTDLPDCLHQLELTDLPGIGKQMEKRFHRAGIFTVKKLCEQPSHRLHEVWGGVIGDRWWHILRGEDLTEKPTQRRTVGHSHVLPPAARNDRDAYAILVKLTHKAAVRLRDMNYWCGSFTVKVSFWEWGVWTETRKVGDVQDTPALLAALAEMWALRPQGAIPFKVDLTLFNLKSSKSCSLPLFPEQQRRQSLVKTMDAINLKMGEGALYLAAMHGSRESAPDRIAFQSIPECRPKHPSVGEVEEVF